MDRFSKPGNGFTADLRHPYFAAALACASLALVLLPTYRSLATANIAMILFGWLMEVSNNGLMHGRDQSPARGERAWWTPFWFGCVAGIGPWMAIGA